MSEYWKSTPKYWCKNCRVYVRDTPLEKRNHEATQTHQNAIKRGLRDIHRGHEREEREKERARAEVARLNGLVSGTGAAPGPARGRGAGKEEKEEDERKRRLEELAGLGVAVPGEVRADMAMAGEWTVTSTRVIEERDEEAEVGRMAVGVRKREVTEEEREEEEAVRGLFKKRKGWGRSVKTMPTEKDRELEDLLSGDLGAVKREVKEEDVVKKEEGDEGGDIKQEEGADEVKKIEPGEPVVKAEPEDEPGIPVAEHKEAAAAAPAPVFKKRKAKNIRQK